MKLPIRYRADSVGKLAPAWARLGPFSMSVSLRKCSYRRLPAISVRGCSPNRVAWRFPDWTAVGFRCRSVNTSYEVQALFWKCYHFLPDPFLGSFAPRRPLPAVSGELGPMHRRRGTLSPRDVGFVDAFQHQLP